MLERRWLGALSAVAALFFCGASAEAGDYVEPAVFASSNGLLNLLVIALPQPVPSISYTPLDNSGVLNPIGWVYQICPMASALPNNQCPAGAPTVSDYGGVRLALQQGDTLQIRLVNQLPALDPIKVQHVVNPGDANLPLNLTNLHTHGLIVEPRAPTLSNPTFGDYVFVQIYNSANGTPVPQGTHQHGSIVKDYADYQIQIPANHPSGAYWFHPHVHGLALNQVSSGLAGIISVGSAGNYAVGDVSGTPFPDGSVRHLILKDMQVLAANPAQIFSNGTAPAIDGEVLNQQASPFCTQYPVNPTRDPRLGSCPGAPPVTKPSTTPPSKPYHRETWGGGSGADYRGGVWYFTINGQQYPTITVTEADGELWRLTNASGSLTYDLQLTDNSTQTPIIMQLVSIDGVSISVPPATAPDTVVKLAGTRFTPVACPPSTTVGMTSTPVCVSQFTMMPSSRAEVWVIYRDQNGNIVTPPSGASATFQQIGITTGPAGDPWPQINLASVQFAPTGPRQLTRYALDVRGQASAINQAKGILKARVPYASAAPLPIGCKPLAAGHHRRIFFGFPDTTDPDVFGLGYEEVDQNGAVIPDTEIPLTAFDPTANTICIPLGPGQTPVTETWELVNLATENHNFHIHQTRFSPADVLQSPTSITPTPQIVEDNLPLPVAIAIASTVGINQYGYCTIAQWRDGDCTSTPVLVNIPFSQVGQFVYHCHILAHEDGGMMAKIQVVPSPSPINNATHDFNGDGKSDIAWADSGGDYAIWLMSSGQIAASGQLVTLPGNWQLSGQRDFNGDGTADWLWRDTSAGTVALWELNGLQVLATGSFGSVPANWSIVGTGDFNGDGIGDILWLDSDTNTAAVWLMNGLGLPQSGNIAVFPTTWTIAGTGDFNGDGKSDILWRDTTAATVGVLLMDGEQYTQNESLGAVPDNWTIVGTGDFNGDGMPDILWRDSNTGTVAIWLMNGLQLAQSVNLGAVPSTWNIAETGDFNGDGTSDILWIDTTGNVAIWFMKGGQISSSAGIGNVGTTWSVQGANAD